MHKVKNIRVSRQGDFIDRWPRGFFEERNGIYSMNDLFGIDPQSPSCMRDISDILRLFSPSEGRFIADFPSNGLANSACTLDRCRI